MTSFMAQLLRCSAMMGLVGLAFAMASKLLQGRYPARWHYAAGLVVLCGFIIPIRPSIAVRIESVAQLGQNLFGQPAAALPPESTATAVIQPMHVVFAIWALGFMAMLIWNLVAHIRFTRACNRWSHDIVDEDMLSLLAEAKTQAKVKSSIALKQCGCISSPMLTGILNPTILLPEGMPKQYASMIFTHELVHYRRGDIWFKLLMLIARSLHWFNPAIFVLSNTLLLNCETSCDERVVSGKDEQSRMDYALALIHLAHTADSHLMLNTAFGGKDTMKKRIASIMDTNKKRVGIAALLLILVLTVIAGITFSATLNNPDQQQSNQQVMDARTKEIPDTTPDADDDILPDTDSNLMPDAGTDSTPLPIPNGEPKGGSMPSVTTTPYPQTTPSTYKPENIQLNTPAPKQPVATAAPTASGSEDKPIVTFELAQPEKEVSATFIPAEPEPTFIPIPTTTSDVPISTPAAEPQ